ncbi:hypothetical protein MED92_15363 [Oceanospirillum sp. MED92]|uniref:Transferrin-binding protein B C-lobe/N-lobe beta barrel domain-containing protein n=2 Tax=Neptuniibacter caesariensis TaxID=207954 RepID=A0A7U8GTK4_NEPCE|nr:hypothetical protein MED92_15363 [Oceanospirillum sp. MED92] [Neptuniibacter caesariensis]
MLNSEEAQLLLATIKAFTINPNGGGSITSLEFVDPPTTDANGTLLVSIDQGDGRISTLAVPAQYGLFTENVSDVYMFQGTWRDGSFTTQETRNPNDDDRILFDGHLGTFVYGVETTQAQLNSFVDSLAVKTATYTGATGFGADVTLNLNFTAQTWTGTFNGGVDTTSELQFGPENLGTAAVIGHIGFTATGTISGTNITSSSISANDLSVSFGNQDFTRTISGTVDATFYGSEAQGIGGIADINKQFYEKDGPDITSFDGKHITTFATELDTD